MNYEAERAMNQKRLRMDGEPAHGVVQGNGLPLNYMDNGHQIPYQPYAGAYNTHYPPPDAFAAYGAPPPGGYAPQNLSYAPPAHQNYPHHQSFPPQQQAQLHMPQTHMVQGYGEVGMHKPAWAPQHLLPAAAAPPDVKLLKPEIKLEPPELKRHQDNELMGGELEQPKIKIKTDIFKPEDALRPDAADKPHDIISQTPVDVIPKQDLHVPQEVPVISAEVKPGELTRAVSAEGESGAARAEAAGDKKEPDVKREGLASPERAAKALSPGSEKKRGRPKGSTNKPKPAAGAKPPPRPQGPRAPPPRPRAAPYQYAVRPFRKDFSGIQFRRRWSDDCLDSSHIPNEVYFGDVPVTAAVLFNYYDANAERERLAAQAAHIAAQKAAAAKLAAARLQARGHAAPEVTTVDSSSSDETSGSSGSGDSDSDDEPIKKGPGRPKGSKNSPRAAGAAGGTPGRRGRPPVPPELREPGITDMKKFCKAAGVRFDYKKLVEGCTKNKERVSKMMELLIASGLEGKPTLDKCRALKQARLDKRQAVKAARKEARGARVKEEDGGAEPSPRRMTRGATGVKPRQKIVISSDEEDATPSARRTLSKLRTMADEQSDSN